MTRDLRICTALNTIAAVVWVLLLLEALPAGQSAITDYGSALGLVVLFFVVPIGGASAWWLRRRRPGPFTRWERRYVWASTFFLTGTWLAAWVPMIFWTGMATAIASRHWPFNVREGPDTTFAKAGFQAHFGFPPSGIDGLYYQPGWEFGDGNTHRMRFHFQDPSIVDRIVRAAGLDPAERAELPAAWVVESDVPEWWPRHGVSSTIQIFRRHSQARLWIDRESGLAYYRSWP